MELAYLGYVFKIDYMSNDMFVCLFVCVMQFYLTVSRQGTFNLSHLLGQNCSYSNFLLHRHRTALKEENASGTRGKRKGERRERGKEEGKKEGESSLCQHTSTCPE